MKKLSLIVRLPNWVGDVVMALPALQALSNLGLELQLVGKPWIADLLAATDLPLISLKNGIWQTSQTLAKITETNKALLLTNSFSSALMMRMAGFKTIGYKTDGRQLLLTAGLAKPTAQYHETHYFWSIAQFASQFWFPELTWTQDRPSTLSLPLNSAAKNNAAQRLLDNHITEPFWVLCPFAHGTGKNGESKIWPYWRELSKQLQHHQLIVCPSKNEEELCSELVPEATVLKGLNLSEYAAILANATQVVANDSGPMHIAAAVGAKTLGLFGVSDPQRTHPWAGNYIGTQGNWPTLTDVLEQLYCTR